MVLSSSHRNCLLIVTIISILSPTTSLRHHINTVVCSRQRVSSSSHHSLQNYEIDSQQLINNGQRRCQTFLHQTNRDADYPPDFSGRSLQLSSSAEEAAKNAIWRARAILIAVSAFYGTNFGCVKILGSALHPGVAALLRFSLAALVFMPQVIKVAQSNKKVITAGLEVGVYSAIGYFAQAESLLSTRASNVAFICSLAVIVVPIIESIAGERKGWTYLKSAFFPALLAAAGVGCLELGGTTVPGVGDLWAFLQPLFFGLGFWRIEHHMKSASQPGEAQAFTGAMMLVVAALSAVWTVHDFVLPIAEYGQEMLNVALQSQFTNIISDWHVPLAIAWTGIVTTALTSFGENIAMKQLDAAESTVIYSTEPLWGAAFASVTLGEHIGWNTILGAVLILTACAWRTVGVQVMGILSSSVMLDAEGFEVMWENMSDNFARLFQVVPELPEI